MENTLKVKAIWEFEVDTEDFSEEFVDIKGLAKDLTQREMENLLQNQEILAEDFSYELENEKQFTDDETQLIYAALMEYANKLYNIAKEVPNESEITNKLTDRAKQSWNLARKIIRQKG